MEKEMTLKDFMEEVFKENVWHAMETARDLIELEAIEQRLNVKWGVELDIKVKPVERKEGRFYGKGLIEAIKKDNPKQDTKEDLCKRCKIGYYGITTLNKDGLCFPCELELRKKDFDSSVKQDTTDWITDWLDKQKYVYIDYENGLENVILDGTFNLIDFIQSLRQKAQQEVLNQLRKLIKERKKIITQSEDGEHTGTDANIQLANRIYQEVFSMLSREDLLSNQ